MSETSPYSKSLLLIWQISGIEAINLKQSKIRPAHLFLGMLKVIEIDVAAMIDPKHEKEKQKIVKDIANLKNCISEFLLDVTYARRFLRGILPIGDVTEDFAQRIPSRTDSARKIFCRAEEFASKTGGSVLPIHLLVALLESEETQIMTVFEKIGVSLRDFGNYTQSCILGHPEQ